MAIPTPTVPSALTAVGATSLKSTQNNRGFYVYSGGIIVGSTETTMISINDIGKRDIFVAFEAGGTSSSGDDFTLRVKVNGTEIYGQRIEESTNLISGADEYRFILPANTSLEVTLQSSSGSRTWFIAGYGNYLE